MLGFKNFNAAAIVLAEVELLDRIGERQFLLTGLEGKDPAAPAIWNTSLAAYLCSLFRASLRPLYLFAWKPLPIPRRLL
jgi:hypothetical protein